MYKEVLERGILPPTLTQALMSLVPKRGKDLDECKNYRPISFMQIDVNFNVFSKSFRQGNYVIDPY